MYKNVFGFKIRKSIPKELVFTKSDFFKFYLFNLTKFNFLNLAKFFDFIVIDKFLLLLSILLTRLVLPSSFIFLFCLLFLFLILEELALITISII